MRLTKKMLKMKNQTRRLTSFEALGVSDETDQEER